VNRYLDQLDQAESPLSAQRRLLAALGPRKLQLARDRCAGAIVLLVTPNYVGAARQILGEQPALVIDQMLVADADPARARQTARRPLRFLSGLPGYTASFTRMGFTGTDIAGLTDRLVDELIIWGDADTIAARIRQQLQAGPTTSSCTSSPRTDSPAQLRLPDTSPAGCPPSRPKAHNDPAAGLRLSRPSRTGAARG
jgi:probable F420-dependent oxidoreductase